MEKQAPDPPSSSPPPPPRGPKFLAWRLKDNNEAEPIYVLDRSPCSSDTQPRTGEIIKICLPEKLKGPISTYTATASTTVSTSGSTEEARAGAGAGAEQGTKKKKEKVKTKVQNKNHTALVIESAAVGGSSTRLVVLPVPSYSKAVIAGYDSAEQWVEVQGDLIHVQIPYYNQSLGSVVAAENAQGFEEVITFEPLILEGKRGFILYNPMTINIPKGTVRYSTFPGRPRMPEDQLDALLSYCHAKMKTSKPSAAASVSSGSQDESEDEGGHDGSDGDEDSTGSYSDHSLDAEELPFLELLHLLGIEGAEARVARQLSSNRVLEWVTSQDFDDGVGVS